MLSRIYGTAWAKQEELDAYLHRLEEAERRDHRRLGREMDLFHFQEEGPGTIFWHPKGWTLFQTLITYMRRAPEGRGLYGGEHAAGARPRLVGDLRPLADLSREHVPHQDRGRARFRAEADELPRPCADLQERAEVLSRPAGEDRRVRHRASLRAVGRAARHDARARLHAGRRAYLLHRRPDHGRGDEDQRPHPVDLRGLRLRRRGREALDAAGEARRLGRGLGQGGSRAPQACWKSLRARGLQDRRQSGRGRLLWARSSNIRCATPSAANGNAARRRWTSICRRVSAPSTSAPTARRRRR